MNIKDALEFNDINIMKLIKKFFLFLKNRIYVNDRIILYIFYYNRTEMKKINNNKVIIKKVDYDNVYDALSFQNPEYINSFVKFLDNGDSGYYAYLNNECVHRSWVQFNQEISLHRFLKYFLKIDEAYIHWCETANHARGNNIYPLVLQKIIQDNYQHKILIAVNKKNYKSINGIEKAGFKKYREYHIILIFGIKFINEIKVEKRYEQ